MLVIMNTARYTEPRAFQPLSKRKQSFLNLALRVAEASECHQRHGAIIVRSGSVLSIGVNKWRNLMSPVQDIYANGQIHEMSIHAEADALSRVPNAGGSTIYVARLRKDGGAALSKPCINCEKKISDAGITKVIYTLDELIS